MADYNDIVKPLLLLNPGNPDGWNRVYATVADANAAIPNNYVDIEEGGEMVSRSLRYGKVVQIGTVTNFVEHHWFSGFEDVNLVPKSKDLLNKNTDITKTTGVNLHDYTKDKVGYIRYTDGLLIDTIGQGQASRTSQVYKVDPNTVYTIWNRTSTSGTKGVRFFDGSMNLLPPPVGDSWDDGVLNGAYTTSADTQYMDFTTRFNGVGDQSTVMLLKGNVSNPPFEPYKQTVEKIDNNEIAASTIVTSKGTKPLETFLEEGGYATGTDIEAIDSKVTYKQDNENYGLSTTPAGSDWYLPRSNELLVDETDPYLLSLGVVKSINFAAGSYIPGTTRRDLFYRYRYPEPINGKYIQFVFFLKIAADDLSKVGLNTAFVTQDSNTPTLTVTPLSVQTTLIKEGLYEVRKTILVPTHATNVYTKVFIGSGFFTGSAGQETVAMQVSGFYCFLSNSNMANLKITDTAMPEIYKRIADVEKSIPDLAGNTNYLKGTILDVDGDSMGKGHSVPENETWAYYISQRNNMTLFNTAINGNKLTNTGGSGVPFVLRYMNLNKTANYILVFIGTNDALTSVPIGTDSDIVDTTFKGALNIVCPGMQELHPEAKIAFITPYLVNSSFLPYITAIETICSKYSIPVFNNAKNGGIYWSSVTQKTSLRLNDSVHLNAKGMLYASYKYESFLRSL